MTDDLLENAIVAAQDQYGDPPAKYAPGNNMPDSVTVAVHHQRATFNGVPLVEDRGHRLLEENRSVLPGNIADKATLRGFLERIEEQYGKARRVWLMDSGVPTEEVLAEMRAVDPPMHYLVGTPKGRLTRLEKHLVTKPWQQARPGVQVKLLAQEGELYVLAQSRDRVAKERAMRRRRLKRLWTRLKQLSTMALSREELLMKLGAARDQSRTAWRLVTIEIAADSATFSYRLDRTKLRQTRSREGRYLLRTNLVEEDPAKLWSHYLLLVAVEEAFKNLKSLPPRRRGAISRSGRSFTSARRASRPTSSLPSWPIACTSRWRGACMRWRRG